MQRRFFLLVGLLLILPAMAKANTLTGSSAIVLLNPEEANQTVTLVLSGTDFYNSADLVTSINGGVGPAPFVTQINGIVSGAWTGAGLLPTIWSGGSGGVQASPNGPFGNGASTGLLVNGGFVAAGFNSQNTVGDFSSMLVSTVGVAPGDYLFDVSQTLMYNGLDENFEPIIVSLTAVPFVLRVVPEPSSIVMGLFAVAGMAAVVIRRRRTA